MSFKLHLFHLDDDTRQIKHGVVIGQGLLHREFNKSVCSSV